MGSLKLSVALVAYNRERFLRKQLESIVAQKRLPDELIIGDDCSTDRTAEIISDFAAHAPFPVHCYVNESNHGYSRNLEHAIQLCSGDVIVFCDDDDVCLPEKLRVTEEEFLASPATGLMVSDSTLVDEQLNPLGMTLWGVARFTTREAGTLLENPISTLARHFIIAAGHTIAFRASLKPYIMPFPQKLPPRVFCDVWIALVLASVTNIACLSHPLVLHRLHAKQIAGVQTIASSRERIGIRSRERERTAQFVSLVEEVISRVSMLDTPLIERNLESLTHWAEHMKMQSQLSRAKRRRLLQIAHALLTGGYHRYSRGVLTAARDLLLLQ